MHVERFRNLIESTRTIPPQRFDIDMIWKDLGCGTVGCILGWYNHRNNMETIHLQELLENASEHFDIPLEDSFELFGGNDDRDEDEEIYTVEQAVKMLEEYFVSNGGKL